MIRNTNQPVVYPIFTFRWLAVHGLAVPTIFFLGAITSMQFIQRQEQSHVKYTRTKSKFKSGRIKPYFIILGFITYFCFSGFILKLFLQLRFLFDKQLFLRTQLDIPFLLYGDSYYGKCWACSSLACCVCCRPRSYNYCWRFHLWFLLRFRIISLIQRN